MAFVISDDNIVVGFWFDFFDDSIVVGFGFRFDSTGSVKKSKNVEFGSGSGRGLFRFWSGRGLFRFWSLIEVEVRFWSGRDSGQVLVRFRSRSSCRQRGTVIVGSGSDSGLIEAEMQFRSGRD
jgi:hypothetical protein